MKILSIETSCDDTCISIFEAKGSIKDASFKVLANETNSQINIHRPYGGVYPVLAKREHAKNLPVILDHVLKSSKLDKKAKPVDLIAVTYGPGLEMCLWEGITFAEKLSKEWDVPLLGVNHMEGHVFSVFGKNKGTFKMPKIEFPAISLLVSGGHTELILSKKIMDYKIIGETMDDAVGEAFDKVARMLELPYPGGPEISKIAEKERMFIKEFLRGVSQADEPRGSAPRARGDSDSEKTTFMKKSEIINQSLQGRNFSAEKFAQSSGRRPAESLQELFTISLPRPMLKSKNLDFSFSGLKTAVLYLIKKIAPNGKLDQKTRDQIALEFENAAIECLTTKTKEAIEKYKAKTLIIGGGVAANKHLRNEIEKTLNSGKKSKDKKIKILFPGEGLSGDNSLMIGIAGFMNYLKKKSSASKTKKLKADGNLRL